MNALEVLDKLESTPSSTEKLKILSANKGDTELAELLDAALNFKRKFFIKKFTVSGRGSETSHGVFMALLKRLEKREITGDAARDAVSSFFSHCNALQSKWYTRILQKNLRAGFGLTEANKAGYNIPDFDVMLAKDGKDCKNLQTIVKEGVYVSPKLDGYRCIAFCSYGEVQLYSRNGSIYENFPSIIEALEPTCKDSSFILDGEIMSTDFNSMQQSAFASKRGTTVGDVRYHVFGWVPSDEFSAGTFKMPTKQRLENMAMFFKSNPDLKNIIPVEQTLVNKVEDILALEQAYLAKGYEGAMALPNIPYYLGKKSNRLMKFKTMYSQDCRVVGVYEGEGKHAGRLGGLKLIQENGQPCDVGSGFTDEDRDLIWQDNSLAIGRIAEIKYQELTPDGVMRFPVFLRWRNDKT